MIHSNPLAARFTSVPSLLGPGMEDRFTSCLTQAVAHADFTKLMDASASERLSNEDNFWPAADDWMARFRPYVVKNGILQIPVKGVLLHDFPYAFYDYATGYDYIYRAALRGSQDPDVKGIALVEHSPGGEVAGCFDCVDRIVALRDAKPIRAFAHEMAYSAAYAIATSAPHIAVSKTGGVGSIGVVTGHLDASVALDKAGLKFTFIHFGKHKVDGNSTQPLSEDVKGRIQARIDKLGEIFVASVARNRGMDADKVRATEALTYSAEEAVEYGLADSIGSLDDALAAYAADLSPTSGEEEMSTKDESAVDRAAHDQAVQAADAAGFERGKAEGTKLGATAERERIAAIIGSDEAKERPAAAMAAAMDSDMPLDKATAFLAKLPTEKPAASTEQADPNASTTTFDDLMNKSPNPEVGQEGKKEENAKGDASDTLALGKSFGLAGFAD